MKQEQMAQVMDEVFTRCRELREAGQKEYAHEVDNAFRNFESVADYLDITREQALFVYLIKHFDGMSAHVKGHRTQRDDIFGRICDAIVYLCLFAGMEVENIAKERGEFEEVPSLEQVIPEVING